jgi:hypothetical protein
MLTGTTITALPARLLQDHYRLLPAGSDPAASIKLTEHIQMSTSFK